MKVVKLVDVSFTKKDNKIKYETSDKIKVKEYLKNDNKQFDEELSFEIKYFLLKEKYDVLQKKNKNYKGISRTNCIFNCLYILLFIFRILPQWSRNLFLIIRLADD